MRWFIVPILWIAALAVALLILRRVRRGRHVVLTGRLSPRLVRMIVVILVLLGVGGEKTGNQANAYPLTPLNDSPNDPMPKLSIAYWLHHQAPTNAFGRFKKSMTSAMMKENIGDVQATELNNLKTLFGNCRDFYAMIDGDIGALKKGGELTLSSPKQALAALDQLEKYSFYDHWLCGYLWRRTRADEPNESADLAALYSRLHQHARITNALIAAHAQVRPPMESPRAWASKAGPRPHEMEQIKAYQQAQNDVLLVAQKLYAASDEGTWKRDGLIQLSPIKESAAPNLIKAGKMKGFPEGVKTRVGRLDLLEAPKDRTAVLEQEWLGRIVIPAGKTVSMWELPQCLSKEGALRLKATIDKALDGDEKAADQIEKVLPVAHDELRKALQEIPKAKGAPRLRMILSLFDDAIMPNLNANPTRDVSADELERLGIVFPGNDGGFGGGIGGGGGVRGGGGRR